MGLLYSLHFSEFIYNVRDFEQSLVGGTGKVRLPSFHMWKSRRSEVFATARGILYLGFRQDSDICMTAIHTGFLLYLFNSYAKIFL